MESIKVLIANGSYLPGKALNNLLKEINGFSLAGFVTKEQDLIDTAKKKTFDLLLLDYTSEGFSIAALQWFKRNLPGIKVLLILPYPLKNLIVPALDLHVNGIVLNECNRVEIIEAMMKIMKGQQFLCGKVIAAITQSESQFTSVKESCEGVALTMRETDILRLIAEGNSNKEIAEILCLSNHTINTHRKNMMSKLGINNTAGLVMYAVKENLLGPNRFLFS